MRREATLTVGSSEANVARKATFTGSAPEVHDRHTEAAKSSAVQCNQDWRRVVIDATMRQCMTNDSEVSCHPTAVRNYPMQQRSRVWFNSSSGPLV